MMVHSSTTSSDGVSYAERCDTRLQPCVCRSRASAGCFHCLRGGIVLFPSYLRDGESKTPECGKADAARKCSCMLSAAGHLGYCRFQQKKEGCEGKLRWWEMMERGHNCTGCLFFLTKPCFSSSTLSTKPCAPASSPHSASSSLSFIKY